MRGLTAPGRRAAIAAIGALGIAGGTLLAVGLTDGEQPAAGHTVSAPGSAAVLSSAPPVDEPEQPQLPAEGTTLPTPSSDVHVTIPAVGLDLPVLPLRPREGVINPPLLTAAYWIQPYGAPVGDPAAADNTLYLAAHSTDADEYGFDPLVASDDDGSALEPGDVVEVSTPEGTVGYTVQRSARYGKDDLATATDVWEAVPGRLVLITCSEFERGVSADNVIVFAQA